MTIFKNAVRCETSFPRMFRCHFRHRQETTFQHHPKKCKANHIRLDWPSDSEISFSRCLKIRFFIVSQFQTIPVTSWTLIFVVVYILIYNFVDYRHVPLKFRICAFFGGYFCFLSRKDNYLGESSFLMLRFFRESFRFSLK